MTRVNDPRKAYESGPQANELIHYEIQAGLRELVGRMSLENVLAGRNDLATPLLSGNQEKAAAMGYAIDSLTIRDLVISGEVKKAMQDKLAATLRAAADLERARGEAATLRSLANSARMLTDHPGLGLLRLMAGIEKGNASVVFHTEGSGLWTGG